MNKNIQFARIDVKKQSRAKQTALVFLGAVLLAVLSFFTVLSVRAYFTSTDTKSGELNFGTIEVKLLNGESEFTASSFQTKYLTGIMPGSTLNFNSINVKNTGTHSAYVLLNLDVSIPSKDGNASKLLHYNKWFNANGEEVNTTNMAINQTKPTLIASGASVTSNIQWKVPSIVGNDYKTSTVTVNMTVYGTQTNLKDAAAYADHQLYASYFICSNASKIANDNGTTYSGAIITQDPLRRIVTSKNLWNSAGVSYPRTVSGITLDYDPSTQIYTFNGTSTGSGDLYIRPNGSGILLADGGETYTISAYIVGGTIEGSYWLSAYINNASWSAGLSTMINSTQVTTGTKTFSSTESITKMYFYVGGAGVVCNNLQVKVQLEKGTTATTYEAYSGVEDTFDINTQTLTRNVEKYEFKGNEYWETYTFEAEGLSFKYGNLPNKTMGFQNSRCSHFENINHAWNMSFVNETGIYSDHNSNTMQYFRAPKGRYDIDTIEEWTAWLAEQYASGTPVTVWYVSSAAEADKQETVLTSKNVYQGKQRLSYQTGVYANTTEGGSITITKGNQQDFDSWSNQQGGDVFEYLKDKPITVSFKIKLYEDDVRTNARATITYRQYNSQTDIPFAKDYRTYYADVQTDGDWKFISVSAPAISTLSNASNINQIVVWMYDYSGTPTNSHFEIKDIQIEVGVAPTDFEGYDPTEYKRVNGVALRQIGDVKDTYTASTKKITRNVNELVLTGNETWVDSYNPIILTTLTSANYGLAQYVGIVICSHDSFAKSNNSQYSAMMGNTQGSAIGFNYCYSGFGVSDLDGFKNYLKAEYAKGNPVTLWYVLKTPKTETLS